MIDGNQTKTQTIAGVGFHGAAPPASDGDTAALNQHSPAPALFGRQTVAASTLSGRMPNVRQALFLKELDRRIQDIRFHLESVKDVFLSTSIRIQPALERMSAYLKRDHHDEKSDLQELHVSAIALRELDVSLKRYDKELEILHANMLKTAEELQKKVDENIQDFSAREMRQNEMKAEAAQVEERKKNECWFVSMILDVFRGAGPSVTALQEGDRAIERLRHQIVNDEKRLALSTSDICSLFERRDGVSRFTSLIAQVRSLVDGRIDAFGRPLERMAASSRPIAAAAAEKGYRLGVTIRRKFFDEFERILPQMALSPELLREVNKRFAIIKKKNDCGFATDNEVATELHVFLGEIRSLVGAENELVRFILRAFTEMMDGVI